MEIKSQVRGEVPPEAAACVVKGHAHLHYPLPGGNWLVVAVPSVRSSQHARVALEKLNEDAMADALEAPDEVRKSALGLREDVKLFVVEVAGAKERMTEEEGARSCVQFADEAVPGRIIPVDPEEPMAASGFTDPSDPPDPEDQSDGPWTTHSETAGGEDADDAVDPDDIPAE